MSRWLRAQLNRLVLVFLFLTGIPLIVAAEKLRAGRGQRMARWGLRVAAWLTGVQIEAEGPIGLPEGRPVILVPNHSSPLDVAALLLVYPSVRFVAAADLYRIPLLASAMRAVGTIPVDRRRPRQGREDLLALAASGAPPLLAVFPEGGIPPLGQRRPFKTGAFSLAIESGAVVVPVAIRGTAELLPPRAALGVRPGRVSVTALDGIETLGLGHYDRRSLRDRTQAAVLCALAEEQLGVESA